ncbi:MAG: transporter [Planctomycetaceae bacterium]
MVFKGTVMGLLRTPRGHLFRRWSAGIGSGVLTLAAACSGAAVSAQESVLFPEPGTRYDLFSAESQESLAAEGADEAGEDEIETDRDSFTPATTTTPVGRVIFESAYTFIDNRDTFDTHSLPESLVRLGITEWLEARLGWNYEVGGAGNTVSSESGAEDFEDPRVERESQLNLGLKFRVNRQQGWIPESAFIAAAQVPTSGPDTATGFVGTYVFGWTLERGMKLDAALRYGYDTVEHDTHNIWAPSVVLKVPVTERLNSHLEYFGVFSSHKERNTQAQYISPGLHYLLTRDLEIGYRLGWGLTDDAARFFVNAGVGYRF